MVKWLKKDKTFVLRPYWQLARLTLERVVSLCLHCVCILVVFVLPQWQLAGSTVEVGGPIIVSSVVNTSTRPQLLQWTLKDPHPPTQLPGSSQPAKFTQLTLYSTDNINLVFFFAQCHFLSTKLLWPSGISPLKDGQGNLTWYNLQFYADNKRGIT